MKTAFCFVTLCSMNQAKTDLTRIAGIIDKAIKNSDTKVKQMDPEGTDTDLAKELKNAQQALDALNLAKYWLNEIVE